MAEKRWQIKILNHELDNIAESIAHRKESLNVRAALLITSSAITAVFDQTYPFNWWRFIGAFFGLAAFICGIVILWPTKGDQFNHKELENAIDASSKKTTQYCLIKIKQNRLDNHLMRLNRSAKILTGGFCILGISIFSSFIAFIFTDFHITT